jgi:hypothetical protein
MTALQRLSGVEEAQTTKAAHSRARQRATRRARTGSSGTAK